LRLIGYASLKRAKKRRKGAVQRLGLASFGKENEGKNFSRFPPIPEKKRRLGVCFFPQFHPALQMRDTLNF
jgi:hypothetical protein